MSGTIPFAFCILHTEEELDQYCKTCTSVLCNECIKSEHRSHNWCKLKNVAEEKRAEIVGKLKDIIATYIPIVRGNLHEVKMVKQKNIRNIDEINRQIQEREKEIISMLNDVKTRLMQKCQDLKENTKLDDIESVLDWDVKELQSLAEYFKLHEKNATDVEILQLYKAFQDKKKIETKHDLKQFEDTSKFETGYVDSTILKDIFGYINVGTTKSQSYTESLYNDTASIELEEISRYPYTCDPVTTICVNSNDDCWIQSKFAKEIHLVRTNGSTVNDVSVGEAIIRDFVKLDNGDLILTDAGNKSLKKWSAKDGSLKQTIQLAPFEPLGVNISMQRELLVGMFDRSPGSVDRNTRRLVQRMTLGGKPLQTIEFEKGKTKWVKYHIFNAPTKLRENYNGDVCVVDKMSKVSGRLVVVKKSGQLKFIYEGQKLGRLFHPFDVCCTSNCEIILSDPRNNTVHVLNSNGEFLTLLYTHCKGPHALTLINDALWIGSVTGFVYIYNFPTLNMKKK